MKLHCLNKFRYSFLLLVTLLMMVSCSLFGQDRELELAKKEIEINKKEIEFQKKEIQDLKDKNKNLSDSLSQKTNNYQGLETNLKKKHKITLDSLLKKKEGETKEKEKNLNVIIKDLSDTIRRKDREIRVYADTIKKYKPQILKLKGYKELEDRVTKFKEDSVNLTQELSELRPIKEEFNSLKTKFTFAENERNSFKSRVSQLESESSLNKSQLSELSKVKDMFISNFKQESESIFRRRKIVDDEEFNVIYQKTNQMLATFPAEKELLGIKTKLDNIKIVKDLLNDANKILSDKIIIENVESYLKRTKEVNSEIPSFYRVELNTKQDIVSNYCKYYQITQNEFLFEINRRLAFDATRDVVNQYKTRLLWLKDYPFLLKILDDKLQMAEIRRSRKSTIINSSEDDVNFKVLNLTCPTQ